MFQKISKSFLGTLLQRSNNQTKQFLDSGEMWSSSVVQRELNSARPHPNNNAIKAENHENAKIERLGGHVTVKTGELWIAYHLGMCHCRFNASQFSQSAPTWPGPWDMCVQMAYLEKFSFLTKYVIHTQLPKDGSTQRWPGLVIDMSQNLLNNKVGMWILIDCKAHALLLCLW